MKRLRKTVATALAAVALAGGFSGCVVAAEPAPAPATAVYINPYDAAVLSLTAAYMIAPLFWRR